MSKNVSFLKISLLPNGAAYSNYLSNCFSKHISFLILQRAALAKRNGEAFAHFYWNFLHLTDIISRLLMS
jgi:hypothetical protein